MDIKILVLILVNNSHVLKNELERPSDNPLSDPVCPSRKILCVKLHFAEFMEGKRPIRKISR